MRAICQKHAWYDIGTCPSCVAEARAGVIKATAVPPLPSAHGREKPPEPAVKEIVQKALDTQVGGNHYKGMKIQPVEFIVANNIPYREANAIKYLCRHKAKNGLQDLRKAAHYVQMLIEEAEANEQS